MLQEQTLSKQSIVMIRIGLGISPDMTQDQIEDIILEEKVKGKPCLIEKVVPV